MLVINNLFSIIEEAKDIINRYVLDKGKSYKVYKSDCCRYIIIYKDPVYKFRIRASLLKKKDVVIIILTAYSYSFTIYYKNKQSSVLWYLKDYHKASFVNDRTLTSAQIQVTKRLWFSKILLIIYKLIVLNRHC